MSEWFNIEVIKELSDVITAFTTVVVAILTYFLAIDNRQLRKAGTEPEVVAYLAPHTHGNGGVNFVLANVGQGPAFQVRFQLAYEEEDFVRRDVKIWNDPARTALTVLLQGDKFASLFGVGFVLFGNETNGDRQPLRPFEVKIHYRDIRGRKYASKYQIDITQFAGLGGLLSKPAEVEISETLKKIESHLARLTRISCSIPNLIDATDLSQQHRRKQKGDDSLKNAP